MVRWVIEERWDLATVTLEQQPEDVTPPAWLPVESELADLDASFYKTFQHLLSIDPNMTDHVTSPADSRDFTQNV
jgi:hypothetical protein